MNFSSVAFLFTFILFSCVITPCRAQTNKIFQWQFSGNALSNSLPSCRTFPITVKPFDPKNNTHGVPPFYMIAFAIGGIPTTELIGTTEDNLAWTVNQPIGTDLLLTVVDSTGSSGGVPPNLFTVVAGQTTQCIPPPPADNTFTVEANVTDTIQTCQPWGLTIKGGVPPYNLTLAALNSPVITNVTMGPTDDAFTFIDRADPGTQLIAAISDLNGRWASGTPIVKTAGSANVDCIGLVSSSGSAAKIKADAIAAAAAAHNRSNTAVVAGVVVTIVVLLLLIGVGVCLYLRRRRVRQQVEEVSPRQFEDGRGPVIQEANSQILSINSFIETAPPPSNRSPTASIAPSNMSGASNPFEPRAGSSGGSSRSGSTGTSGLTVRNPNRSAAFSNFPTASVRRSAKAIEAASESMSEFSERPTIERSQSAMVAGPSGTRFPARSASVGTPTNGQEIIYQHEDGGIVRELPPPYADRGSAPESSQAQAL